MSHLKIIYERFEKYGIIITPIKCKFRKAEVTFLDHHRDVAGISTSTQTEAIL